MEIAKHVIEGLEPYELSFGKGQEDIYQVLQALRTNVGTVISRWIPSEDEVTMLLDGGSIYVQQETFFRAPMPIAIQIYPKTVDPDETRKLLGLDVELIQRLDRAKYTGKQVGESEELMNIRLPGLTDQPQKWPTQADAVEAEEKIISEHKASSSEMNLAEWKTAEIWRLRIMLFRKVQSL